MAPIDCQILRHHDSEDRAQVVFAPVSGAKAYVVEAAEKERDQRWTPIAIFDAEANDERESTPGLPGYFSILNPQNLKAITARSGIFALPHAFRGAFRVVPLMRTDEGR